jgi:4-amino-4-deoxy-L-arabinose transferase-like glycosyltransferase
MSDMLLALWSTLAVAVAAHGVKGGAHPAWPIALAAALGLGFLTKGPIALLLPGFALLWLAVRHRARCRVPARGRGSPRPSSSVGWPRAGSCWSSAGSAGARSSTFFLRENLQRFAASTYDSGFRSGSTCPPISRRERPGRSFFPLAAWHAWRREGTSGRFLVGWLALMLVPLSLSRGKIDYYLLPVLPGRVPAGRPPLRVGAPGTRASARGRAWC